MEWWQPIVSFCAVVVTGIAGYSLKVLIDLKVELAGLKEWRSGVDDRLERHSEKLSTLPSNPTMKPYRG